jgi:multiple sugar transport system permease protein
MTALTDSGAAIADTAAGDRGVARVAGENRGIRYLIGAICVFVCAVMLAPVAMSFFASIKTADDARASPPTYLPQSLSLENYAKVFAYDQGIVTYSTNSLLVAGITILLCLLLAVPAGYGLARFRIWGKEVWFILLLAPLMIPYQSLLIPLYLTFSKMGLANNHFGLAMVHTILQLPFSIYLMRNAFESIPKEIEEAAIIDGSSSFQVLRRIFMPLIVPAIVTVALFAFITSWNEFLSALIFMNNSQSFTVPIMLVNVRTGRLGAVDWGALQAGVIFSIIPCILIYVLLQKYYVAGFLNGAVK